MRHALLLAALPLLSGCFLPPAPEFTPSNRTCDAPAPPRPSIVRRYDVSDIAGGNHSLTDAELCRRLRIQVARDTWDEEGRSLGCENGRLTVRHDAEAQAGVLHTLDELRRDAARREGRSR